MTGVGKGKHLAAPGKIFASRQQIKCLANISSTEQHLAGNQMLDKIFFKILSHKKWYKQIFLRFQDFVLLQDFVSINIGLSELFA